MRLILLLSVVLLPLFTAKGEDSNPKYAGKHIDDWIKRLKDKDRRDEAAKELPKAGADDDAAVEAICARVNHKKSSVRTAAIDMLGIIRSKNPAVTPAILNAFDDHDDDVRAMAVKTLGCLEKDSPAHVADFVRMLQDRQESVRKEAARSVANCIGPQNKDQLPALMEALKDKSDDVLEEIACALGRLGHDARAATPLLVDLLLRRPEGSWRFLDSRIGDALKKIGFTAESVPALIELAKRERDSWAIEALGDLGADAKTAIPVIATQLSNPAYRGIAAKAILKIDPNNADVVDALIAGVSNLNDNIWENLTEASWVFESIQGLGGRARELIPRLIKMVKEPRSGPPPEKMPADKVEAQSAVRRFIASIAIGLIDFPDSVPALIELLKEKDVGVKAGDMEIRHYAAMTLALLGTDAKPAVPILAAMLKEDDKVQRLWIALALTHISPESGEAIPVLTGALKNEYAGCRPFSFLEKLYPPLAQLMMLRSNDEDSIKSENSTLRAFGAAALGFSAMMLKDGLPKDAVAALEVALKDEDTDVSKLAATVLRREPGFDHDKLPFTGEPSADKRARRLAVIVMGGFGSAADEKTMAALTAALKDPEPDVRAAAENALRYIQRK